MDWTILLIMRTFSLDALVVLCSAAGTGRQGLARELPRLRINESVTDMFEPTT